QRPVERGRGVGVAAADIDPRGNTVGIRLHLHGRPPSYRDRASMTVAVGFADCHGAGARMDHYVVISCDGHAGASTPDFKAYRPRRLHDDFDAWWKATQAGGELRLD